MKEHYVLKIDVAYGKGMFSLIDSCKKILIIPYKINHTLNNLNINLYISNSTDVIIE